MGFTAGTQEEHRYQLCRDEYCDRFPCRIYREGYAGTATTPDTPRVRPTATRTASPKAWRPARPARRG